MGDTDIRLILRRDPREGPGPRGESGDEFRRLPQAPWRTAHEKSDRGSVRRRSTGCNERVRPRDEGQALAAEAGRVLAYRAAAATGVHGGKWRSSHLALGGSRICRGRRLAGSGMHRVMAELRARRARQQECRDREDQRSEHQKGAYRLRHHATGYGFAATIQEAPTTSSFIGFAGRFNRSLRA